MGIGSVRSLYREVRDAVLEDGVDLVNALKVITSNVADHLKLTQKGRIAPNKDADIVILTKNELLINDIIANGKEVMRNSKLLVKDILD